MIVDTNVKGDSKVWMHTITFLWIKVEELSSRYLSRIESKMFSELNKFTYFLLSS